MWSLTDKFLTARCICWPDDLGNLFNAKHVEQRHREFRTPFWCGFRSTKKIINVRLDTYSVVQDERWTFSYHHQDWTFFALCSWKLYWTWESRYEFGVWNLKNIVPQTQLPGWRASNQQPFLIELDWLKLRQRYREHCHLTQFWMATEKDKGEQNLAWMPQHMSWRVQIQTKSRFEININLGKGSVSYLLKLPVLSSLS